MPFSNNRNSRDDKSKRPGRSTPPFSKPDSRNPNRRDRPDNRDMRDNNDSHDARDSGDTRHGRSGFGGEKRPYSDKFGGDKRRNEGGRGGFGGDKRPYGDRFGGDKRRNEDGRGGFGGDKRPYGDRFGGDRRRDDGGRNRVGNEDRPNEGKFVAKRRERTDVGRKSFKQEPANDGLIRLNRYIANSGVCSRRKADELIEAGVVSVNGEVVTELGVKVDPAKDEIRYNGERLKREKMVYVLLNKPKDYITTTDDPQERRTVMQLVAKATRERIYPVGRLDRNTTGLLLLTNDGNLAEKLAHPRNNVVKIYNVELDKNLTQGDFNKISFGLELEDGFVKPDVISFVQGGSKREVGIQIHSGKNRIVRRIFEHLGYAVIKLDRVVYANLTKKDLTRGRWRYLEEQEIIQLKHFIK